MKRVLLPLILLGMAVFISITSYIFLVHLKRPRVSDAIIAKSDIPSGTLIEPGMIASIQWSGREFPKGFIELKNKDKVVGRVVSVDIVGGCPITEGCIAPKGSPAGLFAKIPVGMRALTVKVDEVSGVAGFTKPGSKVDVLLAGTETNLEGKEEPVSKIILQNVPVLAVGQSMTQLEGKDKPVVVKTATLLVSPEEAEKLALATKMGTLLLTLRPGGDILPVKTKGSGPGDVWGAPAAEEGAAIVEVIHGGVKTHIRVEEKKTEEKEIEEKKVEEKVRGEEKAGVELSAFAKGF